MKGWIAIAALGVTLMAGRSFGAQWDPKAWTDEETINIVTVGPEEGSYEFPVWLVVIDGQLYLRLGSKASERFEKNTTNPYVGVKIAGNDFPKMKVEPAPEMAPRVNKEMSDKYTSDIFIRYFSHPMTVRLVAE